MCVCALRVAAEMVSFVVCIIGNINDLIFYIILYRCTELFLDFFLDIFYGTCNVSSVFSSPKFFI